MFRKMVLTAQDGHTEGVEAKCIPLPISQLWGLGSVAHMDLDSRVEGQSKLGSAQF